MAKVFPNGRAKRGLNGDLCLRLRLARGRAKRGPNGDLCLRLRLEHQTQRHLASQIASRITQPTDHMPHIAERMSHIANHQTDIAHHRPQTTHTQAQAIVEKPQKCHGCRIRQCILREADSEKRDDQSFSKVFGVNSSLSCKRS